MSKSTRLLVVMFCLVFAMSCCFALAETDDPLHLNDVRVGMSAPQMVEALGPYLRNMNADDEHQDTISTMNVVFWLFALPGGEEVDLNAYFGIQQDAEGNPLLLGASWAVYSEDDDFAAFKQYVVDELTNKYGAPCVYGEESEMSDELTAFYNFGREIDDTYEQQVLMGWLADGENEYILSETTSYGNHSISLGISAIGFYATY